MSRTTTIIAVISAVLTFPITAHADAKAEIATAAQHAGMAAAAANLAQVHTHLHHAMNCLVGPRDADFDKANMNPCAQQGNGAFPDETNPDTKVKLQNAMSAVADGISSNDEATAKKNAASAQSMLEAIR